jgi:hypothetical protein
MMPLRPYMRPRQSLVEESASHIQRMQRALTEMNLMLHVVLSDITGATGINIGAASWRVSVTPRASPRIATAAARPSAAEIIAALMSNYRASHLFTLKENFRRLSTASRSPSVTARSSSCSTSSPHNSRRRPSAAPQTLSSRQRNLLRSAQSAASRHRRGRLEPIDTMGP